MSHRLLTTLCVTLCAFGLNGCFSDDPPTYGNSILDSGEECDGESYIAGICEEGMKDIYKEANPETRCINGKINKDVACIPKSICGNGKLEEDEVCDGNEVSSTPCPEGEVLATEYNSNMCLQSCKLVAGSCIKEPAVCGNDKLEEGEVCDKNQVVDDPCGDGLFLNKPYDISMCSQSCEFIKDNCIKDESVCGDGKIENKEACDYNTIDVSFYDEQFDTEVNQTDVDIAIMPDGAQCAKPTISTEDWPWWTEVKDEYVQYNTCDWSSCKIVRDDTDDICPLKQEYSAALSGIKRCETTITEESGKLVSKIKVEGNSLSKGKIFEAQIICHEGSIIGALAVRLKSFSMPSAKGFSTIQEGIESSVTLDLSTLTVPITYNCFTIIRTTDGQTASDVCTCTSTGKPQDATGNVLHKLVQLSYHDFIEYSFTVE